VCFFKKLPFSTANNVENNAAEIPNKMPFIYFISLCVIIKTPIIISIPKRISYQITVRLKIIGSIKDAKKAPVENIAKAMDILDSLIDPKKVIQCKAIIIPAIENLTIAFRETFMFTLVILIYKNIKTTAITILNQTKGIAFMVINSPKIAVKPAIKTKK